MGLDIYFEKRKRNANEEEQAKFEAACKRMDEIYSMPHEEFDKHRDELNEVREIRDSYNPRKEVAYFRKVNFLMEYFEYEGNNEYKEITEGEVDELVYRCECVLENHEKAEELLPTTCGFFFGSTDYDEYYFTDVEDVRDKFAQILHDTDWENEVVEMYCWW